MQQQPRRGAHRDGLLYPCASLQTKQSTFRGVLYDGATYSPTPQSNVTKGQFL